MLKVYRNLNLSLFCDIKQRKAKFPKCEADAYFEICLHIFTNSFDASETRKFVVSAFFIRKDWYEFL